MADALRDAVERAYSVFRRYDYGGAEGVNITKEGAARVVAFPLRQLPAENLSLFVGRAITTWASEEDFKHFLPRCLEIMAETLPRCGMPASGINFHTLINKLRYAHWTRWPDQERGAVIDFLLEWFTEAVQVAPIEDAYELPFERLSIVACAVDDVGRHLARWSGFIREAPAGSAALRLATDLIEVDPAAPIQSAWISTSHAAQKHVRRWLVEIDVRRVLEASFAEANVEDSQRLFSEALQHVEWAELG